MSRFSLALIGAGRIGAFHAGALRSSESVRITTVVEPRSELPDVLRQPGITHLTSVDALIERGQVDGALVAVPTVHHGRVIAALAGAGIPVLCEKPIGLTAKDVHAVQETAASSASPVRVAFWRRFVPELGALRERIQAGEFGTIAFIASAQWDHVPPSAVFLDPASSGGIAVDCGVHDFDLLRWLTGQDVTAVTGLAADVWSIPPVPGDAETVALSVRLSGGTVASVVLGRRHPPGELQTVQVVGTEAAAALTYVDEDDAPSVTRAFRELVEDFANFVQHGGATRTAELADAFAAVSAAELANSALALG